MPPCASANPGSSDSPVPLDFTPAVQKAAVPARLSEPKETPSPSGHQLLNNRAGSFGINLFWDSSFSPRVVQRELSFKPFWFIFMEMFVGDPPHEGMAQLCPHIQGRGQSLWIQGGKQLSGDLHTAVKTQIHLTSGKGWASRTFHEFLTTFLLWTPSNPHDTKCAGRATGTRAN